MEKLNMQTADQATINIQKLADLFPNCVTEQLDEAGKPIRAIDFDKLRQELADHTVEGADERYQFTWPDKRNAIRSANAPSNKTLRPCREESSNFDTTENLYIEGDNLEVLKILRENYLGKVKMIYIDPPYNTGNDFVYNDDFAQDAEEYMANSGQYDEEGGRLVQNTESNGRFHTDWLNMIYPRLKVAKDLLSDDGVILISIDDSEVENLRKIGDEIFGAVNFISQICLVNNIAGRSDSKHIAKSHEYIVVYQRKDAFISKGAPLSDEQLAEYKYKDDRGEYRLQGIRKRGANSRREDRPNLYYPIYYNPFTKSVSTEFAEGDVCILPKLSDGADGCWRWSKNTFDSRIDFVEIRVVNGRNEYDAFEKVYLTNEDGVKTTKLKSFLLDKTCTTDAATTDYKCIMEAKTFTSPKSVSLLKTLVNFANLSSDSIVLDFFSGSATTAHAVMQLNAEDGGNRKFIMVQLPEETDEKSEAYKAGYKNICEIGKERIRRAARKIVEENQDKDGIDKLDTGFRVLKLDSSNMADVYYTPEEFVQQNLFTTIEEVENIKPDRTPEDLLFQVMPLCNLPLSSRIEVKEIHGKKVFFVADNYLIACFDKEVNEAVITKIAKMQPYYFVMRDSSMATDNVADNFDQIFNAYSKDTIRKIL